MSVHVPPGSKQLTQRQAEVLETIETYIRDHGFAPSTRELGDLIGTKSPNGVLTVLDAIERKGYLSRGRNKARSLRVLRSPSAGQVSHDKMTLAELAAFIPGHMPLGAVIRVVMNREGASVTYEHCGINGDCSMSSGGLAGQVWEAAEQVRMIETARQARGQRK